MLGQCCNEYICIDDSKAFHTAAAFLALLSARTAAISSLISSKLISGTPAVSALSCSNAFSASERVTIVIPLGVRS